MNSWKREKTPWTKFRKKHKPKKKENGEYLFDESRRKELETKADPSKFMAACFSRSFSCRFPANSMGYFCCGHSGVQSLSFIGWWSVPDGWQPLWWGVISFQNFRSLKLRLYFCVNFLASSELIGYIDLTDYYEIWPKCSSVINVKKVWGFFDIPNTFPFEHSYVPKIGKYSIRQLQNKFSRQPIGISKKPHTLL